MWLFLYASCASIARNSAVPGRSTSAASCSRAARARATSRSSGRVDALGHRRVEAATAGELLGVVRLLEARDLHDVARVRRVEEAVAAERHPDVVDVAGRVAEEDEVARDQVAAADLRGALREDLLVGDAGDPDAGLGVGPLHEPRAVEPGPRGRAAPLVRRAQVPPGLGERGPGMRAGLHVAAGTVDQLLDRRPGPAQQLARLLERSW